MLKIYHNSRCSKSREAVRLVENQGIEFEVIEYLKTGLEKKELEQLIEQLTCGFEKLVRVKESEYKENPFRLDDKESVIRGLCQYPKILERPIVLDGKKAIICRPPEKVEEFFGNR